MLLGEREKQMLELVAQGYSWKEVSTMMHCATGTTKNRMVAVFQKLGAKTRTHAVVIAIQRGELIV